VHENKFTLYGSRGDRYARLFRELAPSSSSSSSSSSSLENDERQRESGRRRTDRRTGGRAGEKGTLLRSSSLSLSPLLPPRKRAKVGCARDSAAEKATLLSGQDRSRARSHRVLARGGAATFPGSISVENAPRTIAAATRSLSPFSVALSRYPP